MPPGTYAELLPEEKALLADPTLRLRSSALVARLSDQGAGAVPLLLNLLNEDVRVQSWAKRQWILADIRRAFSRLGRDAAPPSQPLSGCSTCDTRRSRIVRTTRTPGASPWSGWENRWTR